MPAETELGSYSITKPSSHVCRIYPQLKDHLPALWGNAAPDCDVDWVVCDQWSVREDQGGWAVARLTAREEFGVRNGEKCAAEGGDSQCGSRSGWTWRKPGESSSICISPMCLLVELQSFMPYRTLYFIRTEITNATYGWCESVMCTDYISHNATRFSAPQSDVNQIPVPVFQLLHLKRSWKKYPEIIPKSRRRRNKNCD